jgi:hypothetical protein
MRQALKKAQFQLNGEAFGEWFVKRVGFMNKYVKCGGDTTLRNHF